MGSPNNKERITMSQLTFRLDTEFNALSTNINICETLLNFKGSTFSDMDAKQSPHPTPSSSKNTIVNKEYLTQIQSKLHSFHYKIESLTKQQQAIAHQNDYDDD